MVKGARERRHNYGNRQIEREGQAGEKVDVLARAMADVFQERMEPVHEEMGKMRKDMNDGFQEVNQRLQDHDRRFEKIDKRLDDHSHRLYGIDSRLDDHGKQLKDPRITPSGLIGSRRTDVRRVWRAITP